MAAPQVLYLKVSFKRGRPYGSIEALVERITKDTGKKITILNDRLFKVDGKYYFSQMNEYWTLKNSCIELVEAYKLGEAIIGTLVKDAFGVRDKKKIEYDDIKISFVFNENGDLADKRVMAKLMFMPQYKEYKCFNHIM